MHIQLSNIGQTSLWLSTALYLIWFLPQLRLSYRRRSVEGLSFSMHLLLLSGYLADLIYGLGRHMPIAYIAVTCFGLAGLCVQHYQFHHYSKLSNVQLLCALCLPLLCFFAWLAIIHTHNSANVAVLDRIGLWSVFAGAIYGVPQIIKNYRLQRNPDLSTLFIWIAIICSGLDIISAYCLNWDYPNKIGAPLSFALALLLLHSTHVLRYHAATKPQG